MFFFLLLFRLTYQESKYISYPFTTDYQLINDIMYNKITIDVLLGKPKQLLEVSLSSVLYITIILDKDAVKRGFNKSMSTSYLEGDKTISIFYRELLHYVQPSQDVINFGYEKEENDNFMFYFDVTYNPIDSNGGVIGLDYDNNSFCSISECKSSFIEQMIEKGKINRNIFTLDYQKKEFTIGEDESFSTNKKSKNYKICSILNSWSCELKSISTIKTENIYYSGIYALFMIDFKFINVPYIFFEIEIINNILKKEINNKICSIENMNNKGQYIKCNDNIDMESVGIFSFKFENFTIEIGGKDLFFRDKKNNWIFQIVQYRKEEKYILGETIFKLPRYRFYFDKEDKSIGIYYIEIKGNKNYYLYVNVVIIIVGIINILIILYRKNNKK